MRQAVVVLLVGALGCSCGTGDDGLPSPKPLAFQPPIVDFGQVPIGFAANVRLDIINVSSGVARIVRAEPEPVLASEIRLVGVPASLLATASATIDVVFTPETIGTRMGNLQFEVRDQMLTIPVIGTAIDPQLVVSPDRVDFGRVVLNTVATATVTLTNRGMGRAKIAALTLDPDTSPDFVVALDTAKSLDTGESFDFQIQYAPNISGIDVGRVIVADDSDRPVRVAVEVVGEGITSEIQIEPGELEYSGAIVGEVGFAEIELRNIGGRVHTIESIEMQPDPEAHLFFVDTSTYTAPFDVAPGEILRLRVGFAPDDTDPVSGNLEIRSTGLVEPLVVILTGEADRAPEPNLLVVPNPVTFQTIAVGHATPRRVRVENPGVSRFIIEDVPRIDPPGTFAITEWPGTDAAIGPAGSHTFTVVATPSAAGRHEAELVFLTGLDTQPEVRVAVSADAIAGDVPDLLFETDIVVFGRVERPRAAVRRVDMMSVGNANVSISQVTLEGDALFSILTPTGAPRVLTPGERHTIEVAFSDPLGLPKTSTATLVVQSDDPDRPVTRRAIRATTVAPQGDPMLALNLTWLPANADLDIHLVREEATPFDRPNDCCFCNPAPVWTFGGPSNADPILFADVRDGVVGETIHLPSADGLYRIYVHDTRPSGGNVEARLTISASGRDEVVEQRSMLAGHRWNVGQVRVLPQSGVVEFTPWNTPLSVETRNRCF